MYSLCFTGEMPTSITLGAHSASAQAAGPSFLIRDSSAHRTFPFPHHHLSFSLHTPPSTMPYVELPQRNMFVAPASAFVLMSLTRLAPQASLLRVQHQDQTYRGVHGGLGSRESSDRPHKTHCRLHPRADQRRPSVHCTSASTKFPSASYSDPAYFLTVCRCAISPAVQPDCFRCAASRQDGVHRAEAGRKHDGKHRGEFLTYLHTTMLGLWADLDLGSRIWRRTSSPPWKIGRAHV